MHQRPFQVIALAIVIVSVAACGSAGASGAGGASSPSASPSASAASVTFVESMAAFCSSFRSMLLGIGNPDAGTPSELSKKLDDAVRAGDVAAADAAAANIKAELEKGRAQAEIAAGYAPVAPAMVAMATLLVAYEAEVDAHRGDADHTKSPSPGTAFTAAGGDAAYTAMLEGITKMAAQPGPTPAPCPALSGTP